VANLPATPGAPRPECTSDAECRGGLTCEAGRCLEGRGAACPAGGGKLAPVFFAVGQAVLTAEARSILGQDASCIRQRGFRRIVVEGHCDERWTAQANLELGRRRAEAVRALLVDLGVEAGDVEVVSRGEEDPVCSERTEDCWQRNRRADVLAELRE
jgi:peptidoglycan-associated lipoprotein